MPISVFDFLLSGYDLHAKFDADKNPDPKLLSTQNKYAENKNDIFHIALTNVFFRTWN
jgi:hypothetical protein